MRANILHKGNENEVRNNSEKNLIYKNVSPNRDISVNIARDKSLNC